MKVFYLTLMPGEGTCFGNLFHSEAYYWENTWCTFFLDRRFARVLAHLYSFFKPTAPLLYLVRSSVMHVSVYISVSLVCSLSPLQG